jgi:long-subunit fatty acid transport protein
MTRHLLTSRRAITPWSRWLAAALTLVLMMSSGPAAQAQTADDALRFSHHQPATGARMMGFAGAGIAGVADYGALFTNPAGLGYFESSQAGGSFNFLRATDDARYQVGGAEAAFTDQTVSQYGLGNAALIYKMPTARGSLVFGGAFNQTNTFERTLEYSGQNAFNSITDTFLPFEGNYSVGSGRDVSFDFDLPLRAFNAGAIEFFRDSFDEGEYPFLQAVTPGTTIEQADEVIEEGRITEASFGSGFEAAEGVMVGASVNIAFGTYRFSRFYREIDINNENTPDLYSVLVDGSELRGFDELQVEEGIESDLAGVNIRGGLSAELPPNFRVGLVIETPTWYSIDETFGTRITTFFDSGGSLADGSTDANDFDYTIRTPWRLGGGLSYQAGGLRLAGDVEVVDWTQLELDAEATNFPDVNRRIRDLKTVVNSRIGAEYEVNGLALRAGFAYQPDPRDVEIQLADDETTDRSRTFYSAGIGYKFSEQFQINIGWMQERFDDQFRPYSSGTVPGEFDENGNPIEITAPFVDEEIVRNRVLVGLTYSF